jgi:hypothetical protein
MFDNIENYLIHPLMLIFSESSKNVAKLYNFDPVISGIKKKKKKISNGSIKFFGSRNFGGWVEKGKRTRFYFKPDSTSCVLTSQ